MNIRLEILRRLTKVLFDLLDRWVLDTFVVQIPVPIESANLLDSFRLADQPDGARKQPVMKRRVPQKLRRGAGGQAGQIWVMPPSTTSSMPVI